MRGKLALWCLPDDAELEAYRHWLGEEEQVRHAGYGDPPRQRQYLRGRVLLRAVLSYYAPGVAPADWVVSADEHGKPALAPAPLSPCPQFNLSHSRGLTVLAVSFCGPVGVDVEWDHNPALTEQLARHYFSAAEHAALQQLPQARQQQRVVELWTLKEAFLKAQGLGLRLPLRRCSFAFDDPGGVVRCADPAPGLAAHRLWLLRPQADYQVALVLANEGETVPCDIEQHRLMPAALVNMNALEGRRQLTINPAILRESL
ncbi:4'-phosphopantetheinyl transferase superfamily protein [Spongiibacter taiwanensis]|uniref:4'-phosphopantetheinyl transferase family protein n=1 Tax=Spongiibacter taiwanensis TaxID=1748242 RepID=UPI002034B16D|nr:4'-phosphopantetheinyl transferase superfamily protein [Spongiibacter taiwanensis]USA42679.1 4'-phosphopantetheinyl transferase superfamily protein [Spongiibacter taiwanensis]